MTDKGFTDQVKGKVKETVGNITGDSSTKAKGIIDQSVGKAKEIASDVKDVAREVINKSKDAMNNDK